MNSKKWAKRLLLVSIRLLTIKRVSALNIRRYSILCSALVDMPWLVACSIGYGFVAHVAATLVVQPKLMKRKLSTKFEHLLKYILNSRTHKKRHHEAILLIWSLSAGHSVLYIQD